VGALAAWPVATGRSSACPAGTRGGTDGKGAASSRTAARATPGTRVLCRAPGANARRPRGGVRDEVVAGAGAVAVCAAAVWACGGGIRRRGPGRDGGPPPTRGAIPTPATRCRSAGRGQDAGPPDAALDAGPPMQAFRMPAPDAGPLTRIRPASRDSSPPRRCRSCPSTADRTTSTRSAPIQAATLAAGALTASSLRKARRKFERFTMADACALGYLPDGSDRRPEVVREIAVRPRPVRRLSQASSLPQPFVAT